MNIFNTPTARLLLVVTCLALLVLGYMHSFRLLKYMGLWYSDENASILMKSLSLVLALGISALVIATLSWLIGLLIAFGQAIIRWIKTGRI